MIVVLRIENDYADGYSQVTKPVVDVDPPEEGEDLEDWAWEHLFDHTGTNTGRENVDALYTVTITTCGTRPDLVGHEFEFGG